MIDALNIETHIYLSKSGNSTHEYVFWLIPLLPDHRDINTGGIQEGWHSGGRQEASRRHPGDIHMEICHQEASRREEPKR